MENLFEYQYFTNAVLAAFMTSISCGIAGAWVVSKRMVFISGGITHASFGGIGLGYYLGVSPVLGAAVFAVLSGIAVEKFSGRKMISSDSLIAILWSLGMALGIIFIYITPGYAPNLMTYLFGNILTVNSSDLIYLAVLSVALLIFFLLFFRKILYVSFDEEYARSQRINIPFINYSLMILVSLSIVFNIKVVGIILLISLLTLPQNTALLFTRNFKSMLLLSVVFALAGSLSGLMISWYLNIPSGASIIFTLALLYIFIRLIKSIILRKQIRLN
jgi:zinc transport system permease protein